MKRRWTLIALTLLLGVTAFVAWKVTHQHDLRLVGRWLMTYGERATAGEDVATRASGFVPKTEWRFHEDGTGEVHRNFVTVFGAQGWGKFRWWSQGGRVHIHWQEGRTGWAAIQQSTADLYRRWRGAPILHPVEEYEWPIEGPDEIRLEPKPRSQWRTLQVIRLMRLPEDEP